MRLESGSGECSCGQCGILLHLDRLEDPDGQERWDATLLETADVTLPSDPLRSFLNAADRDPVDRSERLSGGRAQLLALTLAWSPKLWLPSASLVAGSLALAVLLVMVGQRVDRSLALLLLAPALGVVAWTMVIAAAAVANLLQVRLKGTAVAMSRSLRMILEHGNGAIGSALRYVVLGVTLTLLLGLLALLGAFPGLTGPGGLAATGILLLFQIVAAAAALGVLVAMCVALLLHPGLAAGGAEHAGEVFRFVWGLLRRQTPEVITRAAIPLGATAVLGLLGFQLLRGAFFIVFTLNQKVLGARFADLLAASPLRFLFGAPELLDPGTAMSIGGVLVALSIVLSVALLLGFLASFMGVSGLLLSRGLDLPARLREAAQGTVIQQGDGP
ncbi:MAG: hypothetical protein ABI333_03650 [bacterium]